MSERTDDPHDFRAQRLYLDHDLAEGGRVGLTREQANYLLNVLRLAAGDAIRVFNGRDGEWRASIVPLSRRDAALDIGPRLRPQIDGPDIDYLFAPLKRARLDYMVQKATEMGVARLRPIMTRFTNAERVNLERMRANAIEAAEQCGILHIPAVMEPAKLDAVLAGWDGSRHLIFCDEGAAIGDPIAALRAVPRGALAVLIGPEGGFAEEERAKLVAALFTTRISLGPRIMRADTAAVAALTLVNAVLGDWH